MYRRILVATVALLMVPTHTVFGETPAKKTQVAQGVILDKMPTRRRTPTPSVRTKAADPRVAYQLRRLGYTYKILANGWYRLTFKTRGGRTQVVRISSKLFKFKQYQVRHICSFGYKSYGGPPSASVAYRLLKQNRDSKVGNWGIFKSRNGNYWLGDFCAKMEPGQGAQTLKSYMLAVLNTADATEKALTGRDAY